MSNVVALRPADVVLTKRQLAQHLGRSERWIEQKVRDANLPVLEATDRLGRRRYSLRAVEDWLAQGQPKARRASPEQRLASLEREMAEVRKAMGLR